MKYQPRVIVAFDYHNIDDARVMLAQLSPELCIIKVGKEMFTLFGPDWVNEIINAGFKVFLDLKFHDIPNTVAKACLAAAKMGVWMVNVHASGGIPMMTAAKQALRENGYNDIKLIAVTVLTSMSPDVLAQTTGKGDIASYVNHLAELTSEAGLDGVVCSAQEARTLKAQFPQLQLVTPGIRPIGSSKDDQHRIVTPEQAIRDGVDYMVVGRPITQAEDPLMALTSINQSIAPLLN